MSSYKLVTYQTPKGPRAGVVVDEKLFDAAALTRKAAYASMLDIINDWSAQTYSFSVSELCGGSHNSNSRHYAGCTADISTINGQHVSASNPFAAAFLQRCRDLGATEVLGPGNAGHSTHIHAGWPRP